MTIRETVRCVDCDKATWATREDDSQQAKIDFAMKLLGKGWIYAAFTGWHCPECYARGAKEK